MDMSEKNMTEDKPNRSTAITIICISIFYLMVGLEIVFVNTNSFVLRLYGYMTQGRQEPLYYLLLLIIGVFSGIAAFVAGIGLWKLKRWAYQSAIAISGLLILINLCTLSFRQIVFHGLILVVLFSKGVRSKFTSS